MPTTKPAASASAAPKKSAKKPAAKKPAAKKKAAAPAGKSELSPNQVKVLKAIAAAKHDFTYADIRKKTGIEKGLTKLVAAQSASGAKYPESLEARKLVKAVEVTEGRASVAYKITAAGKKAAAKA